MKIIDNINSLLGDDIKSSITSGVKLKIAASCFSIYAYEALKSELSKIDSLDFIFTAPTFVPNEVTDKLRKERREFFIPKSNREHSVYGSEFEIQLRNKLTQRAIARECVSWIKKKATFKSNKSKAPMDEELGEFTVGKKVQISLVDMNRQSWQYDLQADLSVIDKSLKSMGKITPEDDSKQGRVRKNEG
jgi:hypothetical protein